MSLAATHTWQRNKQTLAIPVETGEPTKMRRKLPETIPSSIPTTGLLAEPFEGTRRRAQVMAEWRTGKRRRQFNSFRRTIRLWMLNAQIWMEQS